MQQEYPYTIPKNEAMQEAFYNHVFSNFQDFCTQNGLRPSSLLLLEFMLLQGLIRQSEIHHYVVLNEYERLKESKKYKNKTQTIKAISKTYELHENTIWNILKDHRGKFQIPEGVND